jgi:hypothetical protein
LHSAKEIIQENQGTALWSRKLNWVADPKKDLYALVGAEASNVWVSGSIWTTIVSTIQGKNELVTGMKYDNEDLMQQPMELLVGKPKIYLRW